MTAVRPEIARVGLFKRTGASEVSIEGWVFDDDETPSSTTYHALPSEVPVLRGWRLLELHDIAHGLACTCSRGVLA